MIRLPGLNPTQINAPFVNPNVAAAPAQELGTLARSIAGVSEHFHDTAVKVQQAENARIESTYRRQWGEDFDNLQLKLQTESDPQKHIEAVTGFLQQNKDAWSAEELPPAVRDRLALQYDEFATRARGETAANASRLTFHRASLALENEIATAKGKGDRVGFERALTTAESTTGMPPEERERLETDFDRSLSGTTIDLALQQDPALVLEDIERPDFLQRVPGYTPEDLPKIRSAARAGVQRVRTEQIDLMEEALNTGQLTPKDIEAGDYLTAGDVARFKKALVKIEPPSAETHGKAWDMLLANRQAFADPALSDQDYAAKWNDLRSEVISLVPPQFRGDISQELSYRSPAHRIEAKAKPRASSEKQELKSVALERVNRARAANLFGNVGDDADPVVKEKAYRRAEELRVETAKFIEETPDLTLEKITEFTDGQISGDRVKTSARELNTFVPGGAQRLRPGPSMQPLPPRSGTKDKATDDSLQLAPGQGEASDALLPPLQQLENFLK